MTDEQWTAIKTRDKNYDGVFFYGVKTTNNFCRPSCPSRTCNRDNAEIFESYEEAVAHGYKPCKRCHPKLSDWEGAKTALARTAKKYIEDNYKKKFSLEEMANTIYVNGSYMIRTFKEITGWTPLEYHNIVRCQKACEMLENPNLNIAYISASVGYATQAHFSRIFKNIYGYPPVKYRKRAAAEKKEAKNLQEKEIL